MYNVSDVILTRVVVNLFSSLAKFSLQHDETTDVSKLSQLLFMRCVKNDVIKEDVSFCKPLATTTTKTMWIKFWMTSSETMLFRRICFL